jgi:GR25 family glycosyltransferase involved in LPS biosynthesis
MRLSRLNQREVTARNNRRIHEFQEEVRSRERQLKEAQERQLKETQERQLKEARERELKEAREKELKEARERERRKLQQKIHGKSFVSISQSISSIDALKNGFMINLERHKWRYDYSIGLMKEQGFHQVERFEGIDGRNEASQKIFDQLKIVAGCQGEKGCAASHLLLWKRLASEPDGTIYFITEDDVLFHRQFFDIFPEYWKRVPSDFHLLFIGCQFDPKNKHYIVQEPCFCLHAYVISKNGAKHLIEKFENWGFVFPAIDIFLIEYIYKGWKHFYCCNENATDQTKNHGYSSETMKDKGVVWKGRTGGIAYQNKLLGSTIHETFPFLKG